MHKLSKLITLLIVCLLPLVIAGCIQPVQIEDAKTAYCTSLDAYNTAVENLQNLPAGATVEEFEAAAEEVSDAYEQLEDSAWELADAQTAVLEESYDVMRDSLETITDETTLAAARVTIASSVEAYKASFAEVRDVSCGPAQ